MKLLINSTEYTETINIAKNLSGEYNKSVIFHCYWNGILNEKHLYSILSCYFFNVNNNKHKIILWLENNISNNYNIEIEKYAEIRYFSLSDEINNTNFIKNINYNKSLSFYSDVVRYMLLYNYGGVWFDLDCFILQSFDSLFYNFENEICVYQWENQNYPNGAIYISLEPKSEKMKKNIEFIINHNQGWGFQEAGLIYDLPLDLLVLPCSWFDADWIQNPYNIGTETFFDNTDTIYDFNNFFTGSFCYHWHNKWNNTINDNSIIMQLVKIIQKKL
uniref:Alpha 1,4-glycosyltransferase domain-containing protein n=1 Tax=viral metagenome TaxID=1070528 RepID=A0A6C0EBN4_9ZZZZ